MNSKFDEIIECNTNDFSELVRISELNPKKDFIGADLTHVDFGEADLTDFVFTGASLDFANLSHAKLAPHTLDGASIVGAALPSDHKEATIRYGVYIAKRYRSYLRKSFKSNRSITKIVAVYLHDKDVSRALAAAIHANRPTITQTLTRETNDKHKLMYLFLTNIDIAIIDEFRKNERVAPSYFLSILIEAIAESVQTYKGIPTETNSENAVFDGVKVTLLQLLSPPS